jgi:hypothetical protein
VSRRRIYSLLRSEAKLCHRLAEDGEGVSEARPGGVRREAVRPCSSVVGLADERMTEGGVERRKCRSFGRQQP